MSSSKYQSSKVDRIVYVIIANKVIFSLLASKGSLVASGTCPQNALKFLPP